MRGEHVDRARSMRHKDTRAEKKAWIALRERRTLGVKFRRQVPIDRFIVDFYCHEMNLIIELDGGSHDRPGQSEYDADRNQRLTELGYRLLHVTNETVMKHPDALVEMVRTLIPSPGPSGHPLPKGEGLAPEKETVA